MKTELRSGEQVVKEGAANLQKNIETVGGKLCLTCVERKSGYLVAATMQDGTSARLNAAKERAFRSVPQKLRQTLTVDNGKEFAGHERLSQRLAMTIYFAHPYSSNEREHQRPAASVLPKQDRLPRHLTPRPCTRDRATQQSTTKETQLSNSTGNSQQSRLCTSDVNSRNQYCSPRPGEQGRSVCKRN